MADSASDHRDAARERSTSAAPRSAPATVLQRVRRLGGYASWTAAAFALPVAVDRLILFPILNRHLGEDLFGAFVWVLGVYALFRRISLNGFVITLMRNLGGCTPHEHTRLLHNGVTSCLAGSVLLLAAIALGSYPLADPLVRENAGALYLPLYLYSVLFCVEAVIIAGLRVERRFRAIFVLKVIESVLLLINVLVAPTRELWAVGAVYALSLSLAIPGALLVSPNLRRKEPWWNRRTAGFLWCSWPGGAWLTLTEQSRNYAAPILLGILATNSDVAVLVAAVSIGNMFMMPVGVLGGLVLSLLAGRKDVAVSGRTGMLYALAVFGMASCVGLLSFVIGRWAIGYLYESLAPRSLAFYHWIALTNAASCVALMLKPVSIRYASMKKVAGLSVIGMAVLLIGLAILIPRAQAYGAAIALALSALTAAGAWFFGFLTVRRTAVEHGPALDVDADRDMP